MATETWTVRYVLVMQQTCTVTSGRNTLECATEATSAPVTPVGHLHQTESCPKRHRGTPNSDLRTWYMTHGNFRIRFTSNNLWNPRKHCRVTWPLSGGEIWHSTQARSNSDTIIYIWRQTHKHTCLPFNTSPLFRFEGGQIESLQNKKRFYDQMRR